MNKRTLTIIAALAVPIILVGALARFHAKPPREDNVKAGSLSRAPRQLPSTVPAPKSREEELARTKDRIAKIQAMKPQDWKTERLTLSPPGRAPTLEKALAYQNDHLKKLEAMTDEEWNMEHALPDKPLPDVTPAPAAPPSP